VATTSTSLCPAGFRAVSPGFQAVAATVGRRRGRGIGRARCRSMRSARYS